MRAGQQSAQQLVQPYPNVHITSLGLQSDLDARWLLRRALRDAWPAARQFGWHLSELRELDPEDDDVGYTTEDSILYVKLRDPATGGFYPYSFVLATLLHELSHLSVLGHGKAFYRRLVEAVDRCQADTSMRRELRSHVCAELLNAVCDNDARRARALLAVLPEAATCRCKRPGAGCSQLPLEYAAHHGRVALTRLLLEARADAGATGGDGGVPPIVRAAARGNAKTTMVLLAARVDPESAGAAAAAAPGGGPLEKALLAARADNLAAETATASSSASDPELLADGVRQAFSKGIRPLPAAAPLALKDLAGSGMRSAPKGREQQMPAASAKGSRRRVPGRRKAAAASVAPGGGGGRGEDVARASSLPVLPPAKMSHPMAAETSLPVPPPSGRRGGPGARPMLSGSLAL